MGRALAQPSAHAVAARASRVEGRIFTRPHQLVGAWVAELGVPTLRGREVVGFVRYEKFDTQYKMPAGYLPIGAFKGSAWVGGISYFPDPDVVVKVDYTVGGNDSAVVAAPKAFSVGLGWWF